jgi:condensin complex subunit 1
MAEQAVNTIYLLGEQPDYLCGTIIKNLTRKAFYAPAVDELHPESGSLTPKREDRDQTPTPHQRDDDDLDGNDAPTPRPKQLSVETGSQDPTSQSQSQGQETIPPTPGTLMGFDVPPTPSGLDRSPSKDPTKGETTDAAPSFSLAQLVFVVGHTAIKHIVYLELVEREFKRRKDENAKSKWKPFSISVS